MDTFTQFAIGYSIPIYRLPEFVAGAFAGVLALRDTTPAPSGRKVLWLVLGLTLYFAIFQKTFPYVAHGIVAIPCLLAIFTYFTKNTEGWAVRLFSNRTFVFLGEASFALYLVQLVTVPWFEAHTAELGLRPAIGLCFVMTIILACLVHVLVERPMRPLVTRWLTAKPIA
jgi:peptidoglycan/LPS O-acetylase OafA/YrhL